jgi:two-component system NtrC family sensor kinase
VSAARVAANVPPLLQRTRRRLVATTVIFSQLIVALIAASTWQRPRAVALIVVVQALRVALNLTVSRRLSWGPDRLSWMLLTINLTANLVISHLAGWTLPVLFYTAFGMVVIDSLGMKPSRTRALFALSVIALVALLDGVALSDITSATLVAAAIYLVTATRIDALKDAWTEVNAQHLELARAHVERMSMDAAIRERDKLASLGTLAAGIAHEINNPMAYVTSNMECLLADFGAGPLSDEQRCEYVDEVLPATLEGIRRVNLIVSDVRRFARGGSEELVAYDLNGEVRTALRICESKLRNRLLAVDLGDLPSLVGSPRQIGQLVINLVLNAVHATGAGQRITIGTANVDGSVELRVADTGVGMTPEVRARLFEPFFTKRAGGDGLGLGLSVSYGIVQAHGGTIGVSSVPGCGTTFAVRLPLRPPMLATGSTQPTA